jgi:hypothetical protein
MDQKLLEDLQQIKQQESPAHGGMHCLDWARETVSEFLRRRKKTELLRAETRYGLRGAQKPARHSLGNTTLKAFAVPNMAPQNQSLTAFIGHNVQGFARI